MQPTRRICHLDVLCTMDRTLGEGPLGLVYDAAVVCAGETLVYVGPTRDAPAAPITVDGRGCIGLPGLVDCHTHAVWAGSRADEFRRRLAGATYAEVLEAGGGILSTVAATRAAPMAQLVADATARLAGMAAAGVTTVEVKSGYGLDATTERACLLAALDAGVRAGVDVLPTYLGAHTIPAEWRHDRAAYLALVTGPMLDAVADIARFVDVYVDRGAFTLAEGEQVLRAGQARGLVPRVHAEQVAFTGAAAMAARLGASSADHLERVDAEGIAAMAAAGTVAVLLPGAMLYLHDPAPPVAALREAGVRLAVATDLNPGSSPVRDLLTCATLACVTMGLTVEEALLGITREAAAALQLTDRGVLRPGMRADVAWFRPPPGEPADPAVLVQYLGGHRAEGRWLAGA